MNLMMRYALREMLLLGLTSGLTKEVILTTNEAKHPFKLGQCSRNQRKMAGNMNLAQRQAKKCTSVVKEGEADIKGEKGEEEEKTRRDTSKMRNGDLSDDRK